MFSVDSNGATITVTPHADGSGRTTNTVEINTEDHNDLVVAAVRVAQIANAIGVPVTRMHAEKPTRWKFSWDEHPMMAVKCAAGDTPRYWMATDDSTRRIAAYTTIAPGTVIGCTTQTATSIRSHLIAIGWHGITVMSGTSAWAEYKTACAGRPKKQHIAPTAFVGKLQQLLPAVTPTPKPMEI